MPEIWINYGTTDVILDVMAENLGQMIESGTAVGGGSNDIAGADGDDTDAAAPAAASDAGADGSSHSSEIRGSNNAAGCLAPNDIAERLGAIDLSNPFDLVLMHDSQAVRQVVSSLFALCEQRSVQFPGILADYEILAGIRKGLPEGSVVNEFDAGAMNDGITKRDAVDGGSDYNDNNNNNNNDSNNDTDIGKIKERNLIFVAEAEFDGLFGYETVATRLIRRFGADRMLAAYTKRHGDAPMPGRRTKSMDVATKFADEFEVGGIEIVANAGGVSDVFMGHPSETAVKASAHMESHHMMDVEHQKAMIISTGKASSSATLSDALSSVWNCHASVRGNGLCVLVAECSRGLGSDALRMHIEGRLPSEGLRNPSAYVGGMEDLLFLHDVQKKCQIALVSVLPELYTGSLDIIPLAGMRQTVRYVQEKQGTRQKMSVVMDGSRLVLG